MKAATWARERRPSFVKLDDRCFSTVLSLIDSRSAISAFVRPIVTRPATSRSRDESRGSRPGSEAIADSGDNRSASPTTPHRSYRSRASPARPAISSACASNSGQPSAAYRCDASVARQSLRRHHHRAERVSLRGEQRSPGRGRSRGGARFRRTALVDVVDLGPADATPPRRGACYMLGAARAARRLPR